ncbi:SDR family oxidoreductase [Neobacillus sp. CF12]|uniref:SDR family NAD(P)-dependent oxidoreductase n=1 Tax=Neobacillus sp. CF12 TaxID=3055864 RepID=UPI0025A0CB3C|nr:SDR family oxidoreductase [Neobacillus sp. CF12]MDM5327762.1 SDR family oxidoreductase [Neobacillus sp. CF12]
MADYSFVKDKVAVVTGAGSGIGQAISMGLAKVGAIVILVGRSAEKLIKTAELIEELKGKSVVVCADVNSIESVEQMASTVLKKFGVPSILINAAGIHGEIRTIKESDPQLWMDTLMINTAGPYLVCRAFMNEMIELGWGRIVNVSSAASLVKPNGVNSAYATSKAALNHFTRQLASELEGTEITANVIHPGEVKTQMWANIKFDAEKSGNPVMTRWADMVGQSGGDSPEKAVEVILDLLTPESNEINGKFLWIKDGKKKPIPSWD